MIFYHYFLKEDEGWFSSFNGKLIVEREVAEDKLKLISAPGYHPSFKRGLHKIRILKRDFGVNKVNLTERPFELGLHSRKLTPALSRQTMHENHVHSIIRHATNQSNVRFASCSDSNSSPCSPSTGRSCPSTPGPSSTRPSTRPSAASAVAAVTAVAAAPIRDATQPRWNQETRGRRRPQRTCPGSLRPRPE